MWFFLNIVPALLMIIAVCLYDKRKEKKIASRVAFIDGYVFSFSLREKFKKRHPQLNEKAVEAVFAALKDFFICCTDSKWHSMPSKVVDDAWHEFILHTREYHGFCEEAFGKFLHHTPAETFEKLQSNGKKKDGLKTVWAAACRNEGISTINPKKLPRLFAIDKLLQIEGGYIYSHLEHPLNGEVSAHDIKCSSKGGGCASCGGGCGGE